MPTKTRRAWLLAALFFVLAAALTACQAVRKPDNSLVVATPTLAVAPVTSPDAASDWQRIEQAGRIVVGTAADFPPFAAYDQSFRFGGYDPALLQALGQELGLEVVFKDFAFEGLADALALGQIDVAAAALTVTPERAARVDFTQPYFATSEGFLAQRGAAEGSIAAPEDLAALRIGVERGSIYESWLRRTLVDAGLSAAQDLILYTTVDDAATSLVEKRIDLLVTDLPAAQQLAQQHGLPLAGQGLLAQQYALAVRRGADELRSQLDAALATLAANGALARLAEQQLGLEATQLAAPGPLPAAATSEAAQAAAAPATGQAGCINGLAWLEDLSLPDQGMTTPAVMAPAQQFTKAWRVLNTGTCTWDSSYALVFAHGSAPGAGMGSEPVAIIGAAAPGATTELTATLVAPISPGVYQGSWQMQDGAGRGFGERLRVGIQVAGVPTPTPAATQTPVAGILFTADAERVMQGSPVTFFWDVTGAEEVYFYQAGENWRDNPVAAQGEESVIPGATAIYQLRVVLAGGQVEDRLLTVQVEPNPDLPQITHFALSSPGELALGECVSITWRIEGEVEQTAIFRNKELLWEDAPVEGALEDCPQSLGEYEYAAGAQGPGGRNYAVATLGVVDPAAAPAAAPGPVLERFSVLPETLAAGGCVELQWTVSGDATNIQIARDDLVLLDGAPATGIGADCPSELGLRRYQLIATDAAGQRSATTVEVGVGAPVPAATPTPLASAAAAPSAPLDPGQETPAGHEYLLISYRNAAGELVSPLTGTQISLALGEDGTLSGNSGCNRYGSRYQLGAAAQANATLAIEPVEVTEMFCVEPIGLMDQEIQYLNLLPQAAAYLLEAGQLTLLDGAGNTVAIYVTVQ